MLTGRVHVLHCQISLCKIDLGTILADLALFFSIVAKHALRVPALERFRRFLSSTRLE